MKQEKRRNIKIEIIPLNLNQISIEPIETHPSSSSRNKHNSILKSDRTKTREELTNQNPIKLTINKNIPFSIGNSQKEYTKKSISPIKTQNNMRRQYFSDKNKNKEKTIYFHTEIINTSESLKSKRKSSVLKNLNEINSKLNNPKTNFKNNSLYSHRKNIYKIFNKNNENFNKILSLSKSIEKFQNDISMYKTINFKNNQNLSLIKIPYIKSQKSKDKINSYFNETIDINNTIMNTFSNSPINKNSIRFNIMNTESNFNYSKNILKTDHNESNPKKRKTSIYKKSIIDKVMNSITNRKKTNKKEIYNFINGSTSRNIYSFNKNENFIKNTINISTFKKTDLSVYKGITQEIRRKGNLSNVDKKSFYNFEMNKNLNLLKKISFIRNFNKIKIFYLWKKFSRQQNFIENRKKLTLNLDKTIFNKNLDKEMFRNILEIINNTQIANFNNFSEKNSTDDISAEIFYFYKKINDHFTKLAEIVEIFFYGKFSNFQMEKTIIKSSIFINKIQFSQNKTNPNEIYKNVIFLIFLVILSQYTHTHDKFFKKVLKLINTFKYKFSLNFDNNYSIQNQPDLNLLIKNIKFTINENCFNPFIKADSIIKIKHIVESDDTNTTTIQQINFNTIFNIIIFDVSDKLNFVLLNLKEKFEKSIKKFKSLKEAISNNIVKFKQFSELSYDEDKYLLDLQDFFKTFNLKFEDIYEVKNFKFNLTDLKNEIKKLRNEFILVIKNKIKNQIKEKIYELHKFYKDLKKELIFEDKVSTNENSILFYLNKFDGITNLKENLVKRIDIINEIFLKNKNEIVLYINKVYDKISNQIENQHINKNEIIITKISEKNKPIQDLISEKLQELENVNFNKNNIDEKYYIYEKLKLLLQIIFKKENLFKINESINQRLIKIITNIIFSTTTNRNLSLYEVYDIYENLQEKVTSSPILKIQQKFYKKCFKILLDENSSFDEFYKCVLRIENKIKKYKIILITMNGSNSIIYKDLYPDSEENSNQFEIISNLENIFITIFEFNQTFKYYLQNKKIILKILELKSDLNEMNNLINENILINLIKLILAFYLKFNQEKILIELKEFLENYISNLQFLINIKNEYNDLIYSKYPKLFYLSEEEILNFITFSFEFKENEISKEILNQLNKFYLKLNKFNLTFILDDNYSNDYFISGINEKSENFLEFENKIKITNDILDLFMEVEKEIKLTLKFNITNSLNNFSKINFNEWIFSQNSQIGICNLNLIFTNEINQILLEESSESEMNQDDNESESEKSKIKNDDKNSLKNIKSDLYIILGKYNSWNEVIIKNINLKDNINNVSYFNILITLQNHKNVIQNLIKNNVTELESFEWLKHIRYLWQSHKKEILIECGGWSTQLQYNFIGNNFRLLLTPQTEKIFVFNASCFREKSSAFVKINSNPVGYFEIFKEFANNFWIDLIQINIQEDNSNFSHFKKILDVSTVTKNWIFLNNVDLNFSNLIFLSKIMQILQQEIILNEIKENESKSVIKMFCVMGCIKIDQNINLKESYLKSSSRILNIIKPEIKFFVNNIFNIINLNSINKLSENFLSVLNNVENMIKNKHELFYFDFYLLNLFSKYMFKDKIKTENNCKIVIFYIKILFEFVYPYLKNCEYSEEYITEIFLINFKNYFEMNKINFRDILKTSSNIKNEVKIKNFYENKNKPCNENIINTINNLNDTFNNETNRHKLIPLVYGHAGSGKTTIINSFFEYFKINSNKDNLKIERINEYDLIKNCDKFLNNFKEESFYHIVINNNNLIRDDFTLFKEHNQNYIIETSEIKNISKNTICLFSFNFVQNLKYKKLLKHLISLIVQRLKKLNILMNDEYNLSIVEFVLKLFSSISNENSITESLLYYKIIELYNTINSFLNIYSETSNNKNTSKCFFFNILTQSLIIIFSNIIVQNNFENENFMNNLIENMRTLTNSIIKKEIGEEFLKITYELNYMIYLDLLNFSFRKFDLNVTNKIMNDKILISSPQIKYSEYILDFSIKNRNSVFVIGRPYQGKSHFINQILYKNNCKQIQIKLNKELSPFEIIELIDETNNKLQNENNSIIVIDDLNMKNISLVDNFNSNLTNFAIIECDIIDNLNNSDFMYKYNKILFNYSNNLISTIFTNLIKHYEGFNNQEKNKNLICNFLINYVDHFSKFLDFRDFDIINNLFDMTKCNYNNPLMLIYSSFYEKINLSSNTNEYKILFDNLLKNNEYQIKDNNIVKLISYLLFKSKISQFIIISDLFHLDILLDKINKENFKKVFNVYDFKKTKKILDKNNNIIIIINDCVREMNIEEFNYFNNQTSNNNKIIIHFSEVDKYQSFVKNNNKFNTCNIPAVDFTSDNPYINQNFFVNETKNEIYNKFDYSTKKIVSNFTNKIKIKDELSFIYIFSKISKLFDIRKNENTILNYLYSNIEELNNNLNYKSENSYQNEDLDLAIENIEEYLIIISQEEYQTQFDKLYSFVDGCKVADYFQNLLFRNEDEFNLKINFCNLNTNKFTLMILLNYLSKIDYVKYKNYNSEIDLHFDIIEEDSFTLYNLLINVYEKIEIKIKNEYNNFKNKLTTNNNNLNNLDNYLKKDNFNFYDENKIFGDAIIISYILCNQDELNIEKLYENSKKVLLQFKIQNSFDLNHIFSLINNIISTDNNLILINQLKRFNQNSVLPFKMNLDLITTIENDFTKFMRLITISKSDKNSYTKYTNSLKNNYIVQSNNNFLRFLTFSKIFVNDKFNLNNPNFGILINHNVNNIEDKIKNNKLINDIINLTQNSLKNYRIILNNEELINSDFFYLDEFKLLHEENINLNFKNDYYFNPILEKIFLSINNKFLLSILLTIEIMISNNEMTKEEGKFIIKFIKDNFIIEKDNSLKFKKPKDYRNKMKEYIQNLIEIYEQLQKDEIIQFYQEFIEILKEILFKYDGNCLENPLYYLNKIINNSEKLVFYLIFLEDQSINFFKFLINKFLRPIHSIDQFKINNILKKKSRLPISIKSNPSLNITNFLCSLAAYYEIDFYIIRETNFYKLINLSNQFEYKFILDYNLNEIISEMIVNGGWFLFSNHINQNVFLNFYEMMKMNENNINQNFKIFFDLNLIKNFNDKKLEKLIEHFSVILHVDANNVDDLEAAHDMWVNVLDENLLSGEIIFY